MPFVVFLLTQCADIASTLVAIHQGAVEGNPLGLPTVLVGKVCVGALIAVLWFGLKPWRSVMGAALLFGSGATAWVALQNIHLVL